MKGSWPLTYIWLCSILCVPAVTAFICPYKDCFCESGRTIFCVNRGFTSIPNIVSNDTAGLHSLDFDMNDITAIPARSLPSNLTEISFDYNPITTIDSTAFDGSADTLEILTFWGSRFTQIPDAFSHLKALKDFSIYHTNIVNWNEDVMKSIGKNLESLYLIDVGSLPFPSWLQYFPSLTELSIESSSVSSLLDNALDLSAAHITSVSFFNNSLTAVPKTFSNLTSLRKLNLANNKIINITWLPRSTVLSHLDLNNNNISDGNSLSNLLRLYAESLKFFEFQVNSLTVIPDVDYLKQVLKLDFSKNKISDPNSGSVRQLIGGLNLANNALPAIPQLFSNLTFMSELWLTSNVITEIHGSDFPPAVVWVYLGYNLITELTDTSFPHNFRVRYLHLNNNPISQIAVSAFRNLPRLETLMLQETKLVRLPLAVVSVHSLIHIDISNNTGLVCTCAEKTLGSLFQKLLQGDVVGDCGETSIYNFFASLSSSCPDL